MPPAKSEAKSMLSAGHPHAERVLTLLRAARDAMRDAGFPPIETGPVRMDVELRATPGPQVSDATNFLGGIADVLQRKASADWLAHLDDLVGVCVYANDRQLNEIGYRMVPAENPGYTLTISALDD